MPKRYYLIAQYYPQRGETETNPACLFGASGSYVVSFPPLAKIKANLCYKSKARAERYAAKQREYTRFCKYAVYDVTNMV